MKNSKKILAAIMALTLTASVGAFAANAESVNQESDPAELTTEFVFEYKNDPTYTVTIPGSVVLTKSGSPMVIEASDVADLDNQKISVTIKGTDAFRNQMLLEGTAPSGRSSSARYQIIKADSTVIETTGKKDEVVGVELASFTDNGTETLTVVPVIDASVLKGATHTGTMTYGIGLVDLG